MSVPWSVSCRVRRLCERGVKSRRWIVRVSRCFRPSARLCVPPFGFIDRQMCACVRGGGRIGRRYTALFSIAACTDTNACCGLACGSKRQPRHVCRSPERNPDSVLCRVVSCRVCDSIHPAPIQHSLPCAASTLTPTSRAPAALLRRLGTAQGCVSSRLDTRACGLCERVLLAQRPCKSNHGCG